MDARNALARRGRPYPSTQVWGRGWQRMLTGWLTQARWSVLGPQPTGEPRTTAGRSGHPTSVRTAGSSSYRPLTSNGGEGCSGVRVSPPMDAMACQRFARDDASVCHAYLCVAARAEPVDLGECGGTDGEARSGVRVSPPPPAEAGHRPASLLGGASALDEFPVGILAGDLVAL